MSKPYLQELITVKPGNALYAKWIEYALSLSKEDVQEIVNNGLTYQANALVSMINEVIAGGAMPISLSKKLDLISMAAEHKSSRIR